MIGIDEVMSQNKLFNVITCYGAGLKYMDVDTRQPTTHPEIKRWLIHNSLPRFQLEQATDMKYFFSVMCRSSFFPRDGKESTVGSFTKRPATAVSNRPKGKINHVICANFRENASLRPGRLRSHPSAGYARPLGDLMVLMGREPGRDGGTRVRTDDRKVSYHAAPHPAASITRPYHGGFGATGTTSSD